MPAQSCNLRGDASPLIIAHRGDSRAAPENTLPAFERAVQLGADLVELDYYDTLDGQPVVFHDKNLERTTNAERVLGRSNLSIAELELADLKRLDAGSWFARSFAGTSIPTLAEALNVICPQSRALIECKGGDPRSTVNLLKTHRWVDRVVVQSFDWEYLRGCLSLDPKLTIVALDDDPFTVAKLEEAMSIEATIVGWNQKRLGSAEINRIHEHGCAAWVYTVNDPARARELASEGLDGMITDIPGEMLALFTERSS